HGRDRGMDLDVFDANAARAGTLSISPFLISPFHDSIASTIRSIFCPSVTTTIFVALQAQRSSRKVGRVPADACGGTPVVKSSQVSIACPLYRIATPFD